MSAWRATVGSTLAMFAACTAFSLSRAKGSTSLNVPVIRSERAGMNRRAVDVTTMSEDQGGDEPIE